MNPLDPILNIRNSFTEIYERLHPGVYYYAKSILGEEDAADVAADVFMGLLKSGQDFKSIGNVKAWLLTCTKHACLIKLERRKYLRTAKNEITYLLETTLINWNDEKEQREIRKAYFDLIAKIIEGLSDEKRAVFQLSFICGLKNPEVAHKLNIDTKRVTEIKNRLLSLLRKEFAAI